jgi:anaerobic ribonucleoside-triphosphate reductase activating protein
MPDIESFLACVDILLAGRYQAENRVAAGLLGSSNKSIHFLTRRYTPPDLETIPEAEIIIGEDGQIILSGIDPLKW